jgi:hypothetical protein
LKAAISFQLGKTDGRTGINQEESIAFHVFITCLPRQLSGIVVGTVPSNQKITISKCLRDTFVPLLAQKNTI